MEYETKKLKFQQILGRLKSNLVFVLLFFVFTVSAFYFAYQTFIPAFATGTFSDDFVSVDRMEDNVDGRWLTTSSQTSIGTETTFETAEGAGYLRTLNGTTGSFPNIGMKKTYAADLNSNQVWYYFFPGAVSQGNVKDLISNMGVTLCDGAVGAAASVCGGNTMTWYACTGDCSTKLTSGQWNNIKFYTTDPDAISGAAFNATSTASIALMFDASSKMTAKSGFPSQGWDFMRSGTKIIVTGGSASNPVTFQDVKDYVDTQNFDSVSITASTFVNMGTSLQIGTSTADTPTFFTDTDKFVFMDMYNTEDKINFILQPNSTTTFGKFENGFAISGNTVKYPVTASTSAQIHNDVRGSPFVFPSSATPLPELYLYASVIKGAEDISFGTLTEAAIARGQIFDTEIDNASTTFIYSAGTYGDGLEFTNVDIHHSTSSATSTVKIFITPNKAYENIRIFASPASGLDIATTTGGPDQITLKNITLSNNTEYDIRIENPFVVNMINSSFDNASTTYLNIDRGWLLNKQYTFDLTVTDSVGGAVSGASVTLKDKDNTTIFTTTTGGDGTITQQTVTAFQMAHATSSATVTETDFNNFNLSVTATGLNDVSQTVIIGAAQDLTVVMSSACSPDGTDPAYPMNVATSVNDVALSPPIFTVWGDDGNGSGCGIYGTKNCTAMGATSTDPITFDKIREFGKAAYGECAVTNPASGSFAVISQFNIGTTTASTTYV
ncbi:MAG: hypothetical protein HYT27_01080, partial [Parcubacteria group bacterium]|nr:hypothetical protein [Parcubacteria group bacterium]